MSETLTKIDNIKILFKKVTDKDTFYLKVSDEFGIKTTSVRTNWFSRFDIPNTYRLQDQLIDFMQKYIEHNEHRSS